MAQTTAMADRPESTNNAKAYRATRVVMIVIGVITVLYYGLAALVFPKPLLTLFAIEVPASLVWVRAVGAMGLAIGIGLLLAARDPGKNGAMVVTGIVAALVTAFVFLAYIVSGDFPASEWIDVGLLTAFAIALAATYFSGR